MNALHEQDHPWVKCPGCGERIDAHVLVEYQLEKPLLHGLDPVEVSTQAQRDGNPWAGEWVLRGVRIEHTCGQLRDEVLEQPGPLDPRRLSRGGVIPRGVPIIVGEPGAELYRPKVCMCGHVESIHVVPETLPPDESRPCTGAHCTCTDYIERDT